MRLCTEKGRKDPLERPSGETEGGDIMVEASMEGKEREEREGKEKE